MNCIECATTGAEAIEVRYIDDTTSKLELCDVCQTEYEKGSLVSDVTRLKVTRS